MNTSKIKMSAAAPATAALLGGCGSVMNQFFANPEAPPPSRPRVPAGPGWAAEVAYLKVHPVRAAKGMQAGILVRSSSPGTVSQQLNGVAWSGAAVNSGGWTVNLSSDQGDHGMASLVLPGDLFELPGANVPAGAPGDDGTGALAILLRRGAVNVP